MKKNFSIHKKLEGTLGRVGTIHTPHGDIQTPTFSVVGTAATVKSLSPEQVKSLGAEVVLANTYHLYLQPGDEIIKEFGGFGPFMNWHGPTITDSGGFQVFSLGAAFGEHVSKVATGNTEKTLARNADGGTGNADKMCTIDEDGVTFRSYRDGSTHRLTPERSMEIQWNLGADIIFAFDECTSPLATHDYQREAMDRTHRWAKRSIDAHDELDTDNTQMLFGVVQGGQFEDLRRESARTLAGMERFDGFGIGGSFTKEDLPTAVRWVNEELPEDKPRHLLGIGEPEDIFLGVEHGCDTFDCVAPTRVARNAQVFTHDGKISLTNARFKTDKDPIDSECDCYTCANYSRAYLAHLFRAKEMFASTLASIHNLRFIVRLFENIRHEILEGDFFAYKEKFLTRYLSK
ncbi:MAG: queuine tRNA-ribosyltransferase [Flavobacteriaceae bacterium]|jgi:queuine tRNA-ribosyltransferase